MPVDKLYLFLFTLDICSLCGILPYIILIFSCIYMYVTVITLNDICSSVWISDLKKCFFRNATQMQDPRANQGRSWLDELNYINITLRRYS